MNKTERVEAVLAGSKPDRSPVSFWHHFPPSQVRGQPAVDAHVRHFESYDLDFLKIMNDNGYPRPKAVISATDDLRGLQVASGREGPFEDQLAVIEGIRRALGPDVPCCTTVFNAWSTLRNMVVPSSKEHGPPVIATAGQDPRDQATKGWLEQDKSALAAALETIGESLANFVRKCIEAGADGIYLSCRDDWVEGPGGGPGTYDALVRDQDLKILNAASAAKFNVLHVCGKAIDFPRFADYPVAVINWADRQCGPSIAHAAGRVKPAICCGLNNLTTMPDGSAQQCADEVRDALRQAGERPIMIAPDCTYDPAAVPEENLHAIRRAVEA